MRGAGAVVALVLALPLLAATEKWWEAYNRGVKAVNTANYAAAATALQKAIDETPVESSALRVRNEIITYVPHFWLGIARFNLGDVDGALREWRISEEQGAIAKTEYYVKLRDWVSRAQTEKKRNAQSAASGAKKDADAALSRALSAQMEAMSGGADRSDSYRAAQRKLQEALSQFNTAGTDIRLYQQAEATAGQARELFAKAAETAKQQKAARPAAVAPPQVRPARQQPPQTATTPPPQVAQQQPVPQTPPPVQAEKIVAPPPAPVESEAQVAARVELQRYRQRLVGAMNDRRLQAPTQNAVKRAAREISGLEQELKGGEAAAGRVLALVATRNTELTTLLAQKPVVPEKSAPVTIERAWRAYAMGDLVSAERALTQILTSSRSEQALLLRGCTRYTQAILSRQPQPLLDAASGDFRSALKLNSRLRLDARAFSPKLVEFFEKVRKSG